jgi:hypothetical protein
MRRRGHQQHRVAGVRTPQQILEDYQRTGDPADLELWRAYQQAKASKEGLQRSHGVREQIRRLEKNLDPPPQ